MTSSQIHHLRSITLYVITTAPSPLHCYSSPLPLNTTTPPHINNCHQPLAPTRLPPFTCTYVTVLVDCCYAITTALPSHHRNYIIATITRLSLLSPHLNHTYITTTTYPHLRDHHVHPCLRNHPCIIRTSKSPLDHHYTVTMNAVPPLLNCHRHLIPLDHHHYTIITAWSPPP
jgi:hypothetical protein